MENNIDEDIKIVEDFLDITEVVLPKYSTAKPKYCVSEEFKISTKNVLSELAKKDKKFEEYREFHERRRKEWNKRIEEQEKHFLNELDEYDEHRKGVEQELETYKKIAEKLAEEYIALESRLDETVEIDDDYCNFDVVQCFSFRKKSCKECIIDWARKEVEKDDN